MAPVKRGFSQKILWPTPALVGLVAEVLRFAAHCPPPTKSRVCSSSMSAKNLTGWW